MKTMNEIIIKKLKEKFPQIIKSDNIAQGGAEGGNCWGDDAHEFYTGNEFLGIEHIRNEIDEVLFFINPDMRLSDYKKIMKSLHEKVKENEYSHNEYYGNHEYGFYASIELKEIIEVVEECQLI